MGVIGWARASLIANIGIIVTGGLVRLTDSGLGCPRWPKCTDDRWTTHAALGIHGAIEFGNRMLTYVLVAIAIATLVSVIMWFLRSSERSVPTLLLAIALLVGIPLQGVIGGLTVLTDLNPWLVSLHLILSLFLVAGSAVLIHLVSDQPVAPGSPAARAVAAALCVATGAAVYLGTTVTGAGPHAGDAAAPRNGLNPETMSHIHSWAAYLVVALAVAAVLTSTGRARGAAWTLVGVVVGQAAIGVAQYNLGLPIALVALHLLGSGVLVAAVATVTARVWIGASRQRMNGSAAAATNSNAR